MYQCSKFNKQIYIFRYLLISSIGILLECQKISVEFRRISPYFMIYIYDENLIIFFSLLFSYNVNI
jgi:hypothetical protein